MNILNQILETKRREMAEARSLQSFEDILKESRSVIRQTLSFSSSLRESSTGIIAEFKRRSPSKGFINIEADVRSITEGYSENGASAISVLTDRDYFAGSLRDLADARKAVDIPILRKDFIIDPYQICEARIAGADAILLIAAALTLAQCAELAAFAHSLGLEVLLEVHNEEEIGHVNEFIDVIGVNNRDLTSFVTDTKVSRDFAELLPENIVRISESGISDPATVVELRKVGYRGFLMGENFMKQADPAAALGEFIKAVES